MLLPPRLLLLCLLPTLLSSLAPPIPPLRLHDSKTGTTAPFRSILPAPSPISLYTCGPTVYGPAHLGNFRAFLAYDVLKRVLTALYERTVTHICNLTDIDDKIVNKCRAMNEPEISTVTDKYTNMFMRDLQSLNIVPATKYPRATDYIPEIVTFIEDLAAKDLAYQTPTGWWFNVSKSPSYGTNFNSLTPDDLTQDSDFALWKAFKPDLDIDSGVWDTAIGKGRPGWHIECSAIIRALLGEKIDLHCGGVDLQFPHHENEIAQNEGVMEGDSAFCNCWLHNGFVNIGAGEKMSKSLNNYLELEIECPTALDKRAFRYLVVSSHYRSPLTYTKEVMEAAKGAVSRLDRLMRRLSSLPAVTPASAAATTPLALVCAAEQAAFYSAMAADLATPRAAACLFAVVKAAEKELAGGGGDGEGLAVAKATLGRFDEVFGVFYGEEEAGESKAEAPREIVAMAEARRAAKGAKEFRRADEIRGEIVGRGWAVKDGPGGAFELVEIENRS